MLLSGCKSLACIFHLKLSIVSVFHFLGIIKFILSSSEYKTLLQLKIEDISSIHINSAAPEQNQ